MTTLCETISELCAKVAPLLGAGPAADAIARVSARLAEPTLRVAVGGRLNAGKSTLVNAMLGQALAPTGTTECTRLVTWFRYYHQNQILVTPRDGAPYLLPPAPGGTIPDDLGRPAESVASVTVSSSNHVLRVRYTLADTPGLDSLTSGGALDDDSMAALRACDALVFVMPHPGQRDQEALESFRAAITGSGLSLANAVGVLSRIDQLGDGEGDPWPQARRVAQRYASRMRALVADVIPVAGRLAQTALDGTFTEADAQALRGLAARTDAAARDRLLYSPEAFVSQAAPLDPQARARLLEMLGLYGIGESLRLIDGGAASAGRLVAEYRRLSGIDRLLDFIGERFVADADILRARAALADLDHITWAGVTAPEARGLAELRAGLARVAMDPALRRWQLAGLLADLDAGRLRLPPQAEADLVSLIKGENDAARVGLDPAATPEEIVAAADGRIRRWKVLEGDFQLAVARAARDIREAYEAIFYSSG
jgi:hypothetical protein